MLLSLPQSNEALPSNIKLYRTDINKMLFMHVSVLYTSLSNHNTDTWGHNIEKGSK